MVQKTSPYLETKYGWAYGESGWNVGMDDNLVKFSFLFQKTVDAIVSTLPVIENGKSYFLTTENRFYYALDGTYYSSPCPKWFEFKLKSDGSIKLFDGQSLIDLPSTLQLNLNKANLVSADFSGVIQVPDIDASSETKQALNAISANKIIGSKSFRTVNSIAEMAALNPANAKRVFSLGYYASGDGGGGAYSYFTAAPFAANSGTIVASTHSSGGFWVLLQKGPYSIRQFGAKSDGTTNDTVAVQKCIDWVSSQGGGKVYFPSGTTVITTSLNITAPNVHLEGESTFSTTIQQNTLNSPIINNTGAFFRYTGITLYYNGTPVQGATALYSEGANSLFTDFIIRNAYIGVAVTSGTAQFFENFQIFDYETIGFYAYSVNDVFLNNFIINAGNTTRGTLGGIRLYNKVEAFAAVNGDILLGVYSMTVDAATNAKDVRPAYNNFTNVFYDSSVLGVSLEKTVETEFIGCWWSAGRSGAGNPGCTVGSCQSIKFTNPRFFNNGGHGLLITSNAVGTLVNGWTSESNSVTSGNGVSHGIAVANNTSEFIIVNGRGHNGLYNGQQGYGVFVGSGCNYFTVADNDLRGNLTGALTIGGQGVETRISGNKGFISSNKGTATITQGNTVTTVSHGLSFTPTAADIYVIPSSAPSNSGVTSWYITSINSTTFQIGVNAATTAALGFGWSARVLGD